jgi:hypothetical protein
MQFDINQHRSFFIAADTDSAIFTLEPLLIKKLGEDYKDKFSDGEVLGEIKILLKRYSDKLNNEFLNKLSKEKFNVTHHKFNWKTENILKTALWTGKRRYAQYIVEKEGVKVEEIDMKGLELGKSNMNPIFKKFGESFIKNILFNTPKHELDNSIIDFYNSLKQTDPRLLGKPTGVKQINSYIIPPTSGEIFSRFRLKAPSNTKAAVRYSDLLKFRKLDKKFETIIEGDKILIINLKKNPYQIDTIGLPNSKIPDEIDEFVRKYIDIDEIFESMILNKLKELYLDLRWDFPNLNPNIGKFFSF